MINVKADEVIEKLSQSFLSKYETVLTTSMIGNNFIFFFINLLCFKYGCIMHYI